MVLVMSANSRRRRKAELGGSGKTTSYGEHVRNAKSERERKGYLRLPYLRPKLKKRSRRWQSLSGELG